MKSVAIFEKVSFSQFTKDSGIDSEELYNEIILPKRATSGSAGYDFYLPYDVEIEKGDEVIIETGIRCKIDEGYALFIIPRSGLGFKYQLHLANTIGLIDSDYYNADNEGHILIKLVNGNNKPLLIKKGERFAQGVFLEFGITKDDLATGNRNNGFGSTGK